jgi:hypothetical protein
MNALQRNLLVASVLSLLLAACAGSAPRPNDSDARVDVAARTFGGSFDYLYIPSTGSVEDAAFVAASKLSPSDLARRLATKIAPAELKPVRIMVTGPSPEKTAQVILDALSFHRDGGLPHLEFLFVGDAATAARIRPVVEAKGGRFRFVLYQ